MSLTPERLYAYASGFTARKEKAGHGTTWPTFRQAAKSLKVNYQQIRDAVAMYGGDGYLGIGVAVGIPGVGYAEHDYEGDFVIEAYGQGQSDTFFPGKNWRGMPSHPTDNWTFWQTKEPEMMKARDLYDSVTAKMTPTQIKKLEELIDWARSQARDDEAFSNAGEAQ